MKKLTLEKAQELLEFLKGKAADGDITMSQENYLQAMELAVIVLEARERTSLRVDIAPPVIPDGCALVPIEPTEDMVINGFESEPNQFFSSDEEWEAYEEMSGCAQAAHRAKLCWAAMIAAAPKPEVL